MHIPQGASQTIDILPFADALALSGRSGGYDSQKWLYVPDFYTEYRYILGTRGQNPLICIGVNPSTAAPDDLDNTLKSVSRIAEGNGFDSWIMFNVYAQRATRPEDMDRELNPELHRANMAAIIEKRPYLPGCVRDMVALGRRYDARWLCAGKRSAKGHPHHPLYLRKDEKTVEFDVEQYLEGLQ